MKPIFRGLAVGLVALVLVAARAEVLYVPQQHSLPTAVTSKLDDHQLARLFVDAARQGGWVVTPGNPGRLVAVLTRSTHSLTVEIEYSRADYTIKLVESTHLKQEAARIHPAANRALHQLENAIMAAISQVAF